LQYKIPGTSLQHQTTYILSMLEAVKKVAKTCPFY